MNKIWFTSDLHYNHKNLCYGTSNWPSKETSTRKFDTLEKMNSAIVDSVNQVVDQDDVLYMLGDWSFGGIESIWQLRQRVNCKTIHLILGNHDEHIKKNKILPNCHFDCDINVLDGPVPAIHKDERAIFFSVHAQDLFTSVQNYLEIVIDKQTFVLCHYPMEDWYQMNDKGSIMLHGHNHHALDNHPINATYRRMDVGIDWKEFRPFSAEEIIRSMSKRKLKNHVS